MMELDALYSKDGSFWKTYIEGRPPVPASYFDRLFKYHAEHGGHFGTAHDVGAGAAVHSARLAERFSKVIVSDASEQNIEVARSHLQGPQYDFHVARMEETSSLLPPASVDLVFAAAMLHHTDVPRALQAAGHQLRSGGSLIVSCTGLCRLLDEAVQKAHLDLFRAGCMQLVRKTNRAILPALAINASGYDSVALPPELFEPNAVRWKLNESIVDVPGGTYRLTMIPPELTAEFPPDSRIASTESLVHKVDEEWAFKKDISELMAYLRTFPFDMEQEDMKPQVIALKEATQDRAIDGYWVTYTILATRK